MGGDRPSSLLSKPKKEEARHEQKEKRMRSQETRVDEVAVEDMTSERVLRGARVSPSATELM